MKTEIKNLDFRYHSSVAIFLEERKQ